MSFTLANYKWGGGAKGTSGGVVRWSFAEPDAVFPQEIALEAYRGMMREAFEAWEKVANIDFEEVVDSFQSDLRVGWGAIDGVYGVIGRATTYYSKATSPMYRVTDAEIHFDIAENWSTSKTPGKSELNFYTTALHEIGHTMGLLHDDDADTVMYYQSNGNVQALAPDDILGAQTLYGVSLQPNDIVGTWMADVVLATAAPDIIDGLGGLDTVRFEGGSHLYTINDDNQMNIEVQTQASGVTDELKNVERLQFDDGYLAFDTDGNAGAVYRLYQASFDRTPDAEGLGFWLRHFDAKTVDLREMSSYFISSSEFETKYGVSGEVDDEAFLTLLYQNILDRVPDQAGFDFWSDQQANGLSRAAILQYFSEAEETKVKVAAAVDDGIWYV